MKKHNAALRGVTLAGAVSLLSAALPSLAYNIDVGTVRVTGTVRAVCEVSVPAVITMPDLPYNQVPAKDLVSQESYAKNFTIKGSCSGGVKFRYAFTTPSITSGGPKCINTNPDGVLGICLYGPDGKYNNFNGNREVFINNPAPELTMTLRPLGLGEKKVSEYSATLSVKIEPM